MFATLLFGMNYVLKVAKQNEILTLTNKYVDFQSEIESIVYNNITIVYGYLAYLEGNPTFDPSGSDTYVENLLEGHDTYIRNLAVLEDTTIIWTYPREGNEASIGVDLATVDGQKDVVLQVKETRLPVFQGPVNLVQGGIGFIARIPVIKDDVYWGQISLVIDGDAFYEELKSSADHNNLSLILFNTDEYPEKAFFTSTGISKEEALTFDFNVDLVSWKVLLLPKDGWNNNSLINVLGVIASLFVSAIIGYLISFNLFNHELTRYQANHDFLTGLYNRAFLDEYQSLVIAKAQRANTLVGFMLIDLNKFKGINDAYGHIIGDGVLKSFANDLKKIVRSSEAVFRLGGDEFLLIFPDILSIEEIRHLKMRIMLQCVEPKLIDGHSIDISVSIGYAIYPVDGEEIDTIMKVADRNMYEHKSELDI